MEYRAFGREASRSAASAIPSRHVPHASGGPPTYNTPAGRRALPFPETPRQRTILVCAAPVCPAPVCPAQSRCLLLRRKSNGFESRSIRRRQHAFRPAAGVGRGRYGQNPGGDVSDCRTYPQRHSSESDPGGHFHQQSRQGNAGSGWLVTRSADEAPARNFHVSLPLRAGSPPAHHPSGLPGRVRHLRSGRPGKPCPKCIARNSGARRRPASRRLALFHQPLENGLRPPSGSGRRCPNRQRALGRGRISPLPECPEGSRGRRFRRPTALHGRVVRALSRGSSGRGPAIRPPAGRRVPRHQREPISNRQGLGRPASQPVRGGRRRPVDLRLAGSRGHPHPPLQARLGGSQGRSPRSKLPQHTGKSSTGPTP